LAAPTLGSPARCLPCNRYLSEAERYALACGFSGSRWAPLYLEAILDPCFPPVGSTEHAHLSPERRAEARLILDDPATALARGGLVHGRFLAYRARGGKLHTSCFSPRPVPKGAVGDEYTFYILERTRTFLEMGKAVFPQLATLLAKAPTATAPSTGPAAPSVAAVPSAAAGSAGSAPSAAGASWEAVDDLLQETRWVGPTLGKMFLVSTHLCQPRLGLLASGCEVGIGAQEAFKLLWPGSQAPKVGASWGAIARRRSHAHPPAGVW
jgi:hypothetical protein